MFRLISHILQLCLWNDKILPMSHYDFCLTWCWEFDVDFVRLVEASCIESGLTFLSVTSGNLSQVLSDIESGALTFSAHLDRTEHELPYEPVFEWAKTHARYRINPLEIADLAEDKATMHLELVGAGLMTPYTIILPSCNEQPFLPVMDLSLLGDGFVIKPSFGGGGQGVVLDARSFEQVLTRRAEYPKLKYLIQKNIAPQKLDGKDAWFRVIYCDGHAYPCWWDTHTHIYSMVNSREEILYGLSTLKVIIGQIADLCKLGFFSTEIAFSSEDQWVVIDYVNDQIDMRLQSQAVDGVPDEVVKRVTINLANMIKRELSSE